MACSQALQRSPVHVCVCVSFSIPALHKAPVCSPLYWCAFGIPGEQAGAQAASLSALCKTPSAQSTCGPSPFYLLSRSTPQRITV